MNINSKQKLIFSLILFPCSYAASSCSSAPHLNCFIKKKYHVRILYNEICTELSHPIQTRPFFRLPREDQLNNTSPAQLDIRCRTYGFCVDYFAVLLSSDMLRYCTVCNTITIIINIANPDAASVAASVFTAAGYESLYIFISVVMSSLSSPCSPYPYYYIHGSGASALWMEFIFYTFRNSNWMHVQQFTRIQAFSSISQLKTQPPLPSQ